MMLSFKLIDLNQRSLHKKQSSVFYESLQLSLALWRKTSMARMLVPKFAFEVACAPGFASYMDDDVPWDTRSYVRKARPNSIALEKGEFRSTHAR
jgi:hypothetical protein